MSRWLPLVLMLATSGCVFFTASADCADGRLNGEETDLDCGGPACGGCGAERLCLVDGDCASRACVANRCAGSSSSCTDGARSGAETDVDCGGGCSPCAAGQACLVPADCASGSCEQNVCTTPSSCVNGARDGDESDVDCGGSCGPCGPGQACGAPSDCTPGDCVGGACVPACGAPFLQCGGACVDPRIDVLHCGGCGSPCPLGVPCMNGSCQPACFGGTMLCGPMCVDLSVDPFHCGQCNRACGQGTVCIAGTCAPPCPPPQVLCGGQCVLIDRDAQHCGGCNQPCLQGDMCVGGQCGESCMAPLLACPNPARCVDPLNDPMACGDCMTTCPVPLNAVPVCSQGACDGGFCLPGFGDCNDAGVDGCEAEFGQDPAHCGACGRTCASVETCVFGRCCGPLPAGTYQQSCSGCEACDDLLTCVCNDSAQNPVQTGLPISPCGSTISNCDGVLTCGGCP
jgi:hypothetical protein